ncbi:MAG: hypothetical protein QME28_04075 [Candidatus Saccharicenans sp.]|nr:hypothetical protein [Candidatus Saccharicenans sp.]
MKLGREKGRAGRAPVFEEKKNSNFPGIERGALFRPSVSGVSHEFLPLSCFPTELSSPGQKKGLKKFLKKVNYSEAYAGWPGFAFRSGIKLDGKHSRVEAGFARQVE